MGCGKKIFPDYINADCIHIPKMSVYCDFSFKNFPFKDNSFSNIIALNILEHLPDTVKVMEEIWRISKPGAEVFIKVPHYKSSNAFKDPTHKSYFTEDSFEYFDKGKISWYSKAQFKVVKVNKIYQYHIDRYVRRIFPRLLRFVEKFFDNTIESIEFKLVAVK